MINNYSIKKVGNWAFNQSLGRYCILKHSILWPGYDILSYRSVIIFCSFSFLFRHILGKRKNPMKRWLKARETNITNVKLSTSFQRSKIADIMTEPLVTIEKSIRAR